jgi:hypothetical protein
MKYLITTHRWFQQSKGFSVEEIEAKDLEHAELLAAKRERDLYDIFNKARCDIIQIASNEHLAPRKLTLRERLTGVLLYKGK